MIFYPLKKTAYLQEGIYQDQLVFNSLICVSIVIEVFWFCQNKKNLQLPCPKWQDFQCCGWGPSLAQQTLVSPIVVVGSTWVQSGPAPLHSPPKRRLATRWRLFFPKLQVTRMFFLLQRNNTGIKTKPSALLPRSKHCSQLFIQQKSSSKQSLYVGAAIPTPEPPNIHANSPGVLQSNGNQGHHQGHQQPPHRAEGQSPKPPQQMYVA